METDVVHIRPARPKDASALADVYAEAWRGAYRGIIPHLSLERMIARRGEAWWKRAFAERRPLLVLDFDGAASGYATYGRCRAGQAPFQGEIFELYLHPVCQGLGLGEKLFERTRQRLFDLRLKGLMVWALTDNDSACGFYLSLGHDLGVAVLPRVGAELPARDGARGRHDDRVPAHRQVARGRAPGAHPDSTARRCGRSCRRSCGACSSGPTSTATTCRRCVPSAAAASVWAPELLRTLEVKLPHVRPGLGTGWGMTESNGAGTSLRWDTTYDASRQHRQRVAHRRARGPRPRRPARCCPRVRSARSACASPALFLGYWDNPEATRAVLDDDRWYRTGDFGHVVDEFVYLEGRRQDLIIRGGENIYPAEIEIRLIEHPDITEVAVVGVDHPTLGQEVKAYVVAARDRRRSLQTTCASSRHGHSPPTRCRRTSSSSPSLPAQRDRQGAQALCSASRRRQPVSSRNE